MRELSLHLLDIIQNSISAEAELVEVKVAEYIEDDQLILEISDDGCGMTEEEQNEVVDPFVTSRTTREVGLGLPFLKRAAEETDGEFELESKPGGGTRVTAVFTHDHIDRAPLGDIEGTLITILNANPDLDLIYLHRVEEEEFVFDTREVKEELEEVKINNPQILDWLRGYLEERLDELRG